MRNLKSVKRFVESYPDFPEGGLRYLIFHSEPRKNSKGEHIPTNGMAEAGVIVRVGRKVLLDVPRFFAWIDSLQKYRPK